MNKLFYTISALLLFFFSIHSSLVFAQDSLATDTLVAYYLFSGSAADSSGFGNDGEVFGATLTKDRFGNENGAYRFNGTNDFIDAGSSESLAITGDLSLSFWFNADSFTGLTSGIITYQGVGTSGSENNALYKVNFPNENVLNYNHEGNEGDDNVRKFENVKLNTFQWYHTVLTRDTLSKKLKVYIDGELVDSASFDIAPSGGENAWLRFGENHGTVNWDRFFDGILDDIRIYNYVISDSTIQKLYVEKGWLETRDTTLTSNEIRPEIPDEFKLHQNYPNPFNPSTIISYDLPEGGAVSIRIYDLTGRLVTTLVEENKAAGRYQVTLNAAALSSGVYFYELKTDRFSSVKKFTLIK